MFAFLGFWGAVYAYIYALMPTRPYTAGELGESELLVEAAKVLVGGDESDEDVADF